MFAHNQYTLISYKVIIQQSFLSLQSAQSPVTYIQTFIINLTLAACLLMEA